MNSLDRSFVALAHPVRRAIVERLAQGPATVGEATRGVAVSKPAVTKQLKVLEEAGVLGDDGAALRGTFLIDPEGIMRHASVTDLNVGRSPAETLRVLQALQTGELCPVDWRPGVATLSVAA